MDSLDSILMDAFKSNTPATAHSEPVQHIDFSAATAPMGVAETLFLIEADTVLGGGTYMDQIAAPATETLQDGFFGHAEVHTGFDLSTTLHDHHSVFVDSTLTSIMSHTPS